MRDRLSDIVNVKVAVLPEDWEPILVVRGGTVKAHVTYTNEGDFPLTTVWRLQLFPRGATSWNAPVEGSPENVVHTVQPGATGTVTITRTLPDNWRPGGIEAKIDVRVPGEGPWRILDDTAPEFVWIIELPSVDWIIDLSVAYE